MKILRSIAAILMAFGCSTPPAPSKPQAVGVAQKTEGDASVQTPPAVVAPPPASRGALVGTPEEQKKVSDCNNAGNFYDRKAGGGCQADIKLATFNCTLDEIKTSKPLEGVSVDAFDAKINSFINPADPKLKYLLDQCVIPTKPEGVDPDHPDTSAQVVMKLKIYLVLETSSGSGVKIDTKIIRIQP